MELKYKLETVIRVDYNDLEDFLTKRFNLTDPYEFAVLEELSNDVTKSINVCKEEIDKYDQTYLDAVLTDKKPKAYSTRTILCLSLIHI